MMILIFGLFTQINDLGPHGPLVLAHDLDIIVVVVVAFSLITGYVAAEYCTRDSDCALTKCSPGYRVDCHSIRGVNDCTCVATGRYL